MQISKENVFNVNDTSVLEKKNRTSRFRKFIKQNKILSIAFFVFIICLSFNFILIYNFMKILGLK